MIFSFSAAKVSFVPIDEILTVGFSETPSGDGRYLLFQREEYESEQDIELGLVGEYLEINDQTHGAYRGVESVKFHRTRIEVLVADAARTQIQEAEIHIAFSLSDADFQSLRTALQQILGISRVHLAP